MSNPFSFLEFFRILWNASSPSKENLEVESPILRLPDTVVFLFGQPNEWYFTSKNGGPNKDRTTILKKRKPNLTLNNIEEVFLNKAAAPSKTKKKAVKDNAIVAYFINSGGLESNVGNDLTHRHQSQDGEVYDIEYFDRQSLHCFLQGGRGHKSGILQRFIAPHGGGKHNSQIRATWTPKLCVLERRRTKQELHDTRFALCERAITFDGPDVHSVSVPLCGTVLAGRVESICNEIVWRISSQSHCVSTESIYIDDPSEPANSISIERMVVNFKVDGNGNIWILWMNSIIPCRQQHGFAVDRNDRAAAAVPLADTTNNPNISPAFETVVRLPQTTKLSQEPNHCADKKPVNNSAMQATCPSCGKDDGDPHFQATPYKTIITHFEKTMAMLEADKNTNPRIFWPPKRQFIQAAGGVGFGCLPSQLRKDGKRERSQFSEETHIIPPVIREVHPNLKAKSYSISRDDPLFLSKTCSICETCFLSYTRTMSNLDFQKPVDPLPHITNAKYDFPAKVGDRKSAYKAEKTSGDSNKTPLFDVVLPSLPSPIASPPAEREASEKKKDSLRQSNTTSYFTLDDKDGEKKLGHLIMQGGAAVSREKRRLPCRRRNPYRENLERIAD